MKILFTLLFAILLQGNSIAQNENDSLKNIWFNENLSDTIRIDEIYSLVDKHLYTNTDSALFWAKAFLAYAQQNNDKKAEIDANIKLAEVYFELGEFI